MLLTLPGSPILYYGDELGTGDNVKLFDRNGVRTPMQWDDSKPHAGFSFAEKTYAPVIDSDLYGPHRVNVRVSNKKGRRERNLIFFRMLKMIHHHCTTF
jgi:maltose alpha-D-glucosyltransferase/alpha-amylase